MNLFCTDECPVKSAQHQRITAAMAAEVERLKRENANIRVKWTEYGRELEAEREALAAERDATIAERDAEIERLRVKLMIIASAEPGRHNIEWAKAMAATGNNEAYAKWREAFDQCGRLAELLRRARLKMAYMLKHGEWHSPEELIERIDAALTEVK